LQPQLAGAAPRRPHRAPCRGGGAHAPPARPPALQAPAPAAERVQKPGRGKEQAGRGQGKKRGKKRPGSALSGEEGRPGSRGGRGRAATKRAKYSEADRDLDELLEGAAGRRAASVRPACWCALRRLSWWMRRSARCGQGGASRRPPPPPPPPRPPPTRPCQPASQPGRLARLIPCRLPTRTSESDEPASLEGDLNDTKCAKCGEDESKALLLCCEVGSPRAPQRPLPQSQRDEY